MSLATRLSDLVLAVGTDIKQLRIWITGSASGDINGLTTTDKTSVVAAINEVNANSGGTPQDASTTQKGIVELATLAEVATGTSTTLVPTVEGVRQERTALKNEILGGVGPMADTLQELYDLAQAAEETQAINDLITVVNGKANSADVYTKTELGNPETDLVAAYTAAKA